MGVTFYCYRPDHTDPDRSYGPLDEYDDWFESGWEDQTDRRLQPTFEQRLAAGWYDGPSMSVMNGTMVLRALGYTLTDGFIEIDADELLGRVTLARAVPPVDDGGMPATQHGNVFVGGLRPGYFTEAFEAIAGVCEQAKAWGVKVMVA
jgi:hypothetical protein